MIAILGGTGFVGRQIIRQLGQGQEPVRVLYRNHSKTQSKLAELRQAKNVELIEGDLSEPASLERLMQGAEKVIHSAAVTANFKNKGNLYQRVNVAGTHNVIKAAQAAGVKQLILVSGLGTQPAKPGSYMQTRWEMEEAVRNSGLNFSIIQPSIQFGKGGEFFEAQARIIKLLPVAAVIGNGKTKFQPIFVDDVARCVVESLTRPDKVNQTVAIGGPEYYTYTELINLIVRTLGKNRLKLYLPLWAAGIQAQLFNLLPQPPLTPATLELFAFDNITSDPQVVEHQFGFKPAALKTYLEQNGIG